MAKAGSMSAAVAARGSHDGGGSDRAGRDSAESGAVPSPGRTRSRVRVRRTGPEPQQAGFQGGIFGNRRPSGNARGGAGAVGDGANGHEPLVSTWRLADFIVLEELYRANSGFVHHVRHRPTGKEYVLKARQDAELGRHKDIMHEVRLLTRLRHPNIIRCFGYFWNDSRSCLCVHSRALHAHPRSPRSERRC